MKLKEKVQSAEKVIVKLFGKLKRQPKRSGIIYTGLAVTAFGIGLIFIPAGFIAAGLAILGVGYYWEDDG